MLRKKFQGAENETNDAAKQQAQDEEEENYKAIRLEKLQRVQDRHHERYMNAKRQLDASLESLRNEAIQTTPLIRSRDQDKALWQLNFARKDRANFCLQKMDREQWDSIRLSQPSDGSEPRCLQPTEDGEKDPRSNFEDEISMGGVVFKRFRHGRGRERKARRVARPRDDDVDTQKTYGHDQVLDEADLDEEERAARQGGDRNVYFQYDGNFAYGQRHGEDSTTVTFFYTLLGDHFNGTPVKAHELRYANGDIYSGQLAPVCEFLLVGQSTVCQSPCRYFMPSSDHELVARSLNAKFGSKTGMEVIQRLTSGQPTAMANMIRHTSASAVSKCTYVRERIQKEKRTS